MEWFRLYSEMLTDPKLEDFTDSQIGIWIKLLCLANQQTQRGYMEIMTTKKSAMHSLVGLLGTRIDRLRTALRLFSDRKMVAYDLDGKEGWIQITNWDKRQFESDSSTPRVRKHREKKRFSNVQSRTEQRRNVSLNETVAPPEFDGGDLERATHGATPSQSPNGQENPHGCAESLLEADKKKDERAPPSTDHLISMAEKAAEKFPYPEAVDDVKKCLAEGKKPWNVYGALYELSKDYDPERRLTPRTFFRILMDSRTISNADHD